MKIRFDDANLKYLEQKALKTGRTITTIINSEIEACRSSILLNDFFDVVDHPEIFRLTCSSTTMEVQRLITLIRSGMLKNLTFGARPCGMNGHVLAGYAELLGVVVLFDNVNVNHAREPRIREVQELMKALGSAQLNCPINLIQDSVTPTREEPIEKAWAYYSNLAVTPFDLKKFLLLIAPTQSHDNLLRYLPDDGYCIKIEKKSGYGGDDLVFLQRFKDSSAAEEQFQKLLKEGIEHSDGNYTLTLNVYGRPEKYTTISSPNLILDN